MKLIESYTTTHDSIPVETGKNDGDRTNDDLISRQQAIMAIEQHRIAVLEGHKWDEGIEYGYAAAHRHLVDIIEQLPSAQPELEDKIREIGYTGKEGRIYIGGRLFAVRELPQ